MTKLKLFTTILLITAMVLIWSLIQAAETEKDLKNVAKKIDEAAASPQGAEKVTRSLSEKFNVPESAIKDLRAQKLGFGEIGILLALSKATGKSTSELLQRFKSGEGWGKIARNEDVKLGQLISAVEKANPTYSEGRPKGKGREEVDSMKGPGQRGSGGFGEAGGRGMGRSRR